MPSPRRVRVGFWFSMLAVGVGWGQWVQTGGPEGGDVRDLVVSGSDLFAGTDSGRDNPAN